MKTTRIRTVRALSFLSGLIGTVGTTCEEDLCREGARFDRQCDSSLFSSTVDAKHRRMINQEIKC